MGNLSEKAAFLKGLLEGMQLDTATQEGKLLMHIVDAIAETAAAFNELKESQEELGEYIESLDEDLAMLEEIITGEDDDDEDDDDEFDFMIDDDEDDDDPDEDE